MSRHQSANMKDVAALAGVSVATVSNVLNLPELVSDSTKARVIAAIEELGWVRNESARQLRSGASRSIGMVVLDIANPFFSDVMRGVEDFVAERGYSVHFGNSAQDLKRERRHLELFEQQRVRGVLFAPTGDSPEGMERLRRLGIPVVIVDRASGNPAYCEVSVDDVEGGRLAAEHLLERGHRRLAFVGGPPDLKQVQDRYAGAEHALSKHPGVSLTTIPVNLLDVSSGREAAKIIAQQPNSVRPSGVFAANDLLAIGLLQGFVALGFSVPADVAIIGYDDIEFAAAAAVPLSSIRQPRVKLGVQAAEMLFEEIAAADANRPHEHHHVRFAPELVIRSST